MSNTDFQTEPKLSPEDWLNRFVARMTNGLTGEELAEIEEYARNHAGPSYLEERHEYESPEDAADTDISYMEE